MKTNRKFRKINLLLSIFCLIVISSRVSAQIITTKPTVTKAHPRVFIMSEDIPKLREKINKSEYSQLKNTIYKSSQPIFKALIYLLDQNKSVGQSAIQAALSELKSTDASANGRKLWNSVFKGACVYDWCYDLLTSSQKQEFQKEFARIHNSHPPYWPVRSEDNVLTGHSAAGWYWNQIIAGLAIYNENPVIFDTAMDIFFKHVQASRNFYYASAMHPQGHYLAGYFTHEMQVAWLLKKLTGKDAFIPEQQYVPYQLLYSYRPDKQLIRRGDVSDDTGVYTNSKAALGLTAEYYNDPYLRYFHETGPFREYNEDVVNLFVKFLLRSSNTQTKSLETLPLTKYFPEPVGGEMIARTGWDLNSYNSPTAIVHMRIGQYYWGNHQHKDFGTFQIYYKGNLTGDTGLYQDGSDSDYNSIHWRNYYRSTIAHNGLLIYDPNEKYSGGTMSNTQVDGGARWPLNNNVNPRSLNELIDPRNGYQYGKIIAHEFGPESFKPEFSYISGDITWGYNYSNGVNTNRAKQVTRSMVTFNTDDAKYPCIFVVFDKVISTNSSFKKSFLLHSMYEPSVSGNKSTILRKDNLNGKLVSYTLLPDNSEISKIGGAGQEYLIQGKNYSGGTVTNRQVEEFSWRVEISPSVKREDDEFLHVMAVMDQGTSDPGAEKIISGNLVGAKVLDRVVTFSKNGSLLSHAKLNLDQDNQIYKILLCNMESGTWQVKKDGQEIARLDVSEEGKTLYLKSRPGNLEFIHLSLFDKDLVIEEKKQILQH
ncbi:heparinase II/III domain-containing protein [Catalinimonas niigatensis]|uniref:heparinase II/III domain-containing protein n=1 Tax=Catalinimonas niigatensis TaxID=1397264 RepID=UPI0026653AB0|nr:heparinase II/III family protein [Catalinimonas niigatensis]WPP50288.1 heparinase II/III family protein [Catalinimonas niigatensis]